MRKSELVERVFGSKTTVLEREAEIRKFKSTTEVVNAKTYEVDLTDSLSLEERYDAGEFILEGISVEDLSKLDAVLGNEAKKVGVKLNLGKSNPGNESQPESAVIKATLDMQKRGLLRDLGLQVRGAYAGRLDKFHDLFIDLGDVENSSPGKPMLRKQFVDPKFPNDAIANNYARPRVVVSPVSSR